MTRRPLLLLLVFVPAAACFIGSAVLSVWLLGDALLDTHYSETPRHVAYLAGSTAGAVICWHAARARP